ncbi:ABC transporter permease [Exilibacterium tricleocarpae]|nr:FtsX-like permease family protein [Exilibacterium tricleocarpae]
MAIAPIFRSVLRSPAGAVLISLQIALTLAIVSNSIFIIKERVDKMARPTGMPEEQILTARVMYFGKNIDYAAQARRDLDFLLQQPGVMNATHTNSLPLAQGGSTSTICYTADSRGEEGCPYSAAIYNGGYRLLDTLGLNLLEGRDFRVEEILGNTFGGTIKSQLIILSKATADKYFPAGDALGKTLYVAEKPHTIIGIVERLQSYWVHGSEEEAEMAGLLPVYNHDFFSRLVIRAESDAIPALKQNLERDLLKLNDRRVISRIHTVKEMRDRIYADDQAMLVILICVIVLLVVITGLGTAGLVSFTVARRQKQIGTRRALGARKVDILGYFLLENGLISGAGAALGCALAIALNQYLMQSYELPRIGLEYVAATVVLLLLIGQSASYFPALRASTVSPAVATRTV